MPRVQRGKGTAISTRWSRRVAAPCVCFVPWEALASCRPLPQQLLPASAAGGGRRRCTFFALLRFEGPSAAAAAAPRGGAGCALSVTFGDTLSPFCRCATSSPDRGKSFKGRGKKRSHHALGSPFGGAGAKRLRGFTPRRGAGSPLARCSHREPAAADAVCRYDSSREKTKKKSPQAFLFLQIKNNFSAMIVRAKRKQF